MGRSNLDSTIISIIIVVVIIIGGLYFWGSSETNNQIIETEQKQVDENTSIKIKEIISTDDITSLQKFSDIVFLIDNEHFDEWYDLQEKLKSIDTNIVLQAVEQGRKSMQNYKNQIDSVIIPQLSDKSITKQLTDIKNDFQTAYSASMYYFAFVSKMVSSNDMSEIDISWTSSQMQIEEMLKYKKEATAGLLVINKYLQ